MEWVKLFVSTPPKEISTLSPSHKQPSHKRLLQNAVGILHHVRLMSSPNIALFWFFSSSASESRASVLGMCDVEWQCQSSASGGLTQSCESCTLNEVTSLGKRWEAAEENLSDREGWRWDRVLGGRWGRLC